MAQIINYKKRILWADIIRIIAIYMVVQLHTLFVFRDLQFSESVIAKISILCVPFFVMISGALLLGKKENYATFFQKRCLRVLLPWIIWTFFYMYFNLFIKDHDKIVETFFSSSAAPLLQWFEYFVTTFLSNLWFLPLIFGLYLLTPALRIFLRHAGKQDTNFILVLWFFIFSLLPFLKNSPLFPDYIPAIFFAPLQYIGYFILGYLLIKKNMLHKIPLSLLLLLGLIPIGINLLPFDNLYIQTLVSRYLNPGVVLASIALYLFLYLWMSRIDARVPSWLRNIIIAISKASFGVYLVHEIVAFFFLKQTLFFFEQHMLSYFIAPCIFLISAVLVYGIQKIPFGKYIFP